MVTSIPDDSSTIWDAAVPSNEVGNKTRLFIGEPQRHLKSPTN
jgi:hypothetical protein